jgi:hypothetical protein
VKLTTTVVDRKGDSDTPEQSSRESVVWARVGARVTAGLLFGQHFMCERLAFLLRVPCVRPPSCSSWHPCLPCPLVLSFEPFGVAAVGSGVICCRRRLRQHRMSDRIVESFCRHRHQPPVHLVSWRIT